MAIYKPSELREFLAELNIHPRKGLSQNFLIDGNIVRKIVATANVEPGDVVLEVGPGPGSLTQALLDAGAIVIAVEKDEILAGALARLQTVDQRLHTYSQDIMTFPFETELKKHLVEGKKAKVIANLPYHLTTPILAKFIVEEGLFSSLTVMVQDEVAKRFTARCGTSDYSSFTVFLEFYSHPIYNFLVKKSCFYPAPSIESAIVTLSLRSPPLSQADSPQFFELTRTAFEHRRKMLRGSLKDLYSPSDVMAALEKIGKNPMARPENLTLEDFLQLFQILR